MGERSRGMKMSNYKGSVRNRLSVPEVGEAVRGDTERHYKKKRDDSQKP